MPVQYNQHMPKLRHYLRLQRPNILVADMERALGIYRDIIGFELHAKQR